MTNENEIYKGEKCVKCDAEIEIFDQDGDIVYLSCPNSEGDDGHTEYRSDIKTLVKCGWDFDKDEIIKAAITDEITVEYNLADFGEVLGVYPDATVGVGQSVGDEIAKDERPIATVGCPGINNVDQSVYTDGWTTYDEENDVYVSDEGVSLTFEQCVKESCDADSSFKEGIIEKLLEALGDK